MSKYIRFTAWLSKKQLAALKKRAKTEKISATEYIRLTLEEVLGVE